MDIISSLQNPRIKNIIKLSKSHERKLQKLFVIEGYREIYKAIESNVKIKEIYLSKEIMGETRFDELTERFSSIPFTMISKEVFQKIAYRENSDGIIALGIPEEKTLSDIVLSENPLLLVVESVEKPGNLGALMRTADAANIDAVIICDPKTDIYNPNVIRSSLGCIFTKQVVICSAVELKKFLNDKKILSYATSLATNSYYFSCDFKKPSAIIMGTESEGLSDFWLENADFQIKIPMEGITDSLNVSVSAAILIFEAKRQRKLLE